MVTATELVELGERESYSHQRPLSVGSGAARSFAWRISVALWLAVAAFTAALLQGTDLKLSPMIAVYGVTFVAYCCALMLLQDTHRRSARYRSSPRRLRYQWIHCGSLACFTLLAMTLSVMAVASSSKDRVDSPAPLVIPASGGVFSLTAGEHDVLKVAELGDSSLESRVHIYRVFNEGPDEIEVTHGNKALTRVPAGSSVDVDVGRTNYKLLVVKLVNHGLRAQGSYDWVATE